jgi:ABC-type cobalamin/Fe3+-siderophores transport system ATPase subunit
MGRFSKIGVLNKPSGEDKMKALEAMKLLGIEDLTNKPIGKLSGGQQQKVMIARAISKEPKILLLDEPFSSLDPESREMVSEMINWLNRERGITAVIVTHDLRQIHNPHSRVIVMSGGRIVAEGDFKSVLNSAKIFFP